MKNTYICSVHKRRYFTKDGYTYSHYIWNINNPENVITKGDGCVIHHKDENILNDSIENLQKMTRKEHIAYHNTKNFTGRIAPNKGSKHTVSSLVKMRESKLGQNNPMFGKEQSVSTRNKIQRTLIGKKKSAEHCAKLKQSFTLFTVEDVKMFKVFRQNGKTYRQIGNRYNVCPETISNYCRGKICPNE